MDPCRTSGTPRGTSYYSFASISPDEFVSPAFELAAPRVKSNRLRWLLSTPLVHLLDYLNRPDDIANLAALAVPNQFHLALFLKHQKEKLVRQRLDRFGIAEDLLFSCSVKEILG